MPSKDQSESRSSVGVRETIQLRRFRAAMAFLLMACGIALGIGAFFLIRSQEKAELADSFDDSATRLIDQVHGSIELKIGTLESFSTALTSYTSFKNMTWPYVTIPDFEYHAASVRALSQAISIELCPLVSEANRDSWESYVQENLNWIEAGLAFEELVETDFFHYDADSARKLETSNVSVSSDGVASEISYYAEGGNDETIPVPPSEYYIPVWQSSPVSTTLVNLDLHSTDLFSKDIDLLVETEQTIVGTTVDPKIAKDPNLQAFGNSFETRNNIGFFQTGGPVGFLYVPILDSFKSPTRKPAALLTTLLNWESYLFQALPPHTPEIRVVLTNACGGEAFTYSIFGEYVEYVGIGNLHDHKFDPFKIDDSTFEFESSLQAGSLGRYYHGVPLKDSCQYRMEIYPTQAYEDRYLTSEPWVFFAIALAVFLLLIAIIYVYDRRVEKNYQLVYRQAKRAGAIVSSIFPAAVRQRLYQDEEDSRNSGGGNKNAASGMPSATDANTVNVKGILVDHAPAMPPISGEQGGVSKTEQEGEGEPTRAIIDFSKSNRAIADLFPDVTIMFAGVVGK
jgi:hypothetical protein